MFYIRKMNSTATLTNNYQVEENGETTTMSVIGQVGVQDSKGFDFDVTLSPVSTFSADDRLWIERLQDPGDERNKGSGIDRGYLWQ